MQHEEPRLSKGVWCEGGWRGNEKSENSRGICGRCWAFGTLDLEVAHPGVIFMGPWPLLLQALLLGGYLLRLRLQEARAQPMNTSAHRQPGKTWRWAAIPLPLSPLCNDNRLLGWAFTLAIAVWPVFFERKMFLSSLESTSLTISLTPHHLQLAWATSKLWWVLLQINPRPLIWRSAWSCSQIPLCHRNWTFQGLPGLKA